MSGYLLAAVAILAGAAMACALSRLGRNGKAEAPACSVDILLDAGGRGSIRINGQELAELTRAVVIRTHAGELSSVNLELIPKDGLRVRLQRADIHIPRTTEDIHAAETIRHAATLIRYDRAGRKEAEDLLAKLEELASSMMDDRSRLETKDEHRITEGEALELHRRGLNTESSRDSILKALADIRGGE